MADVILSFRNECALCREYLNPEDGTTVFAVSSGHPDPGRAEWREEEGLHLLYLGGTAGSRTCGQVGELPGMYLIHPCCNDVIATANRRRSLFDCLRSLGPVLHEEAPTTQRTWPWSSSCVVYGPILGRIFSETMEADIANAHITVAETVDIASLRDILKTRLDVFDIIKARVPVELSDMILDHLPFKLALALDYVSCGSQCLRRLRQNPIASRFECAFQVLGLEVRKFQHYNKKIKLHSEMTAQFLELGGKWYLQDLYAKATKEIGGQGQVRRIKRVTFEHNHDRSPYVAVQVDNVGITHIGFDLESKFPRWISPNKVNRRAAFFQDRSSAQRFETLIVISDERESYVFINLINANTA